MLAHHTPKREYKVPRRAVLLLLGVTALFGSTLALTAPARNPQLHYLGGEACGNGTTSPGAGRADSAEEGARTTTPLVAVASQGPQMPEDLPPPSIRFDRISIADGLSFSKVDAVLQDRQGFLWVGTERGLNKYDGYQFTVYRNDPADPRSLSHDRIYALYEDSTGELWVGTAVGLDRLDRATGTFVHYQAGLGGNPFTGMPDTGASVFAIQEDRNGVLWVGGMGGLYHLDPDSQAPTRSPAWQQVGEIAENIDGQLWVADVDGLYLHDPETDQRSPAGLGVQSVYVIYVAPRGDVWVGAADGLRRMDHSTGSVVHYQHDPDDPNSLGDNGVNALLEDSAGRLWVGTDGGLDLFDRAQNRFVHYRYDPSDPYSLSDDNVFSLHEDRSGVLWIGTTRGLSKYSWAANRFTLYTRLPDVSSEAMVADTGHPLETSGLQSLSSDRVWAVHEDHTGNLWVGILGGGLNRLDRTAGTLTVYRHNPADPNSLSSDTVREIYEDRSGTLWVGTDSGLDQFEPGSGTFLKNWGLGVPEVVWAITEDRAGELWVGTWTDLYCFDREAGTFRSYQRPGWSSAAVRSLYADETGPLWVGTQGAGLYQWDGARFTSYQPQTSNPYNASAGFIRSIYADMAVDSGAVWAGTDASGLLRFDRATPGGAFRQYTEKDGLVGNRVQCILADANGSLWLATNRGVSRFDPATQTFRNYDARDGLHDGETWDCFQSSRGEMFLGGLGGLAAFYPEQIKDNAQPPPIAITAFRLLNEAEPMQLPADGRVQLSYQQNDLSIEFAALDYHAPGKNQYAYRMEGVDRDWVSAGTRRYVNYTNLQPGNYVFRVKGSNNDGVWNEEGMTLHVTIRPPFWGTWWFRGLVAVLLVGAALGAYRLRVRSIEARSRELERQVADRTAELSQTNVLLEQEIAERQRTEEALAQERASAAVAAERNRLARELHDSATQSLYAVTLYADAATRLLSSGQIEPAAEDLGKLRGTAKEALGEMRMLIFELRPPILAKQGLAAALGARLEAVEGRAGLKTELHVDGESRLPPGVEEGLYRIAVEALNNALRHAQARCISVSLYFEPEAARLQVADDGIGFDPAAVRKAGGLGLRGMEERAEEMGGTWSVDSSPGTGTTVTVVVPAQMQPGEVVP
jgi:signal transduction histidine kinase/ligand-binding sensor domain-containing protein